jgi:tellurite resistance protein
MRHLAKQTAQPVHREPRDVRAFPEVREMLEHVDRGGYAEAIVRMMILLARARGAVRRERLERANALLHAQAPFATMDAAHRNQMIHEQSLIVDLAQHEAIAALPRLLRDDVDRIRALNLVLEVAGPAEEMDANTIAMFERFQSALSIRARNWTGVTRQAGSAAR